MDFIGSIEEKTIKDFLEGYSSDFNDKVRDFVVEKLIVLAQGEKTSSVLMSSSTKTSTMLFMK
jgi:hypothetical protein